MVGPNIIAYCEHQDLKGRRDPKTDLFFIPFDWNAFNIAPNIVRIKRQKKTWCSHVRRICAVFFTWCGNDNACVRFLFCMTIAELENLALVRTRLPRAGLEHTTKVLWRVLCQQSTAQSVILKLSSCVHMLCWPRLRIVIKLASWRDGSDWDQTALLLSFQGATPFCRQHGRRGSR